MTIRLAALISGGGRTLLNLADRIDDGSLDAEIAIVIASREDIAGVERARSRGLEVVVADRAKFLDDALHDQMTKWMSGADVDLVVCCGWLRWLRVDEPLRGCVMNIHPSLLPEFGGKGMYGMHVHRAVLEAGKSFSGCTVHFVDEHYDHGPTILQRACPVLPDDTADDLAARVFEQECLAYPEAIRLFAAGRLHIDGDRVRILPETKSD